MTSISAVSTSSAAPVAASSAMSSSSAQRAAATSGEGSTAGAARMDTAHISDQARALLEAEQACAGT